MKKMKAGLAVALCAAMTIGLAACGGGSSSTASTGETEAAGGSAAASSEDLNVMLETPVESLDPQQATDGTSFEVIADYTDGLMQMDADGAPVPADRKSVV